MTTKQGSKADTTTATTTADDVTKADLTAQVSAFLANPVGWPAAMAARAVRLATGHAPYSPGNQALIVCQLWQRFADSGMDDDAAFAAAIGAMSSEIAPRGVWRKRDYVPAGPGLAIWSRPIPLFTDENGATAFRPNKLTGSNVTPAGSVFRVERTFLAADVRNGSGESGESAFQAPELPEGKAKDVFRALAGWIRADGWTVSRSGRDMAEGGYTSHGAKRIVVHGGLTEWAAVETLVHEIAHALLHGDDDDRPYAGEHRGDMEAEAESVAFGFLTAFGQTELARGSARYVAEWTRSAERVAVAYEKACHVTDALVRVAMGEDDVTVRESGKAAKAASKARNAELAASLRDAGVEPRGDAWKLAKDGVAVADIVARMAAAS
jgi:hypothetical protein